MTERRHDELERRHADILDELRDVATPEVLRSRSFLDSIYERAAEDLEREVDPQVADELRRELPAPEHDIELESTALRELTTTPAPGLLRPRIHADCREWRAEWLRRRRRTNILRASAAAALLAAGLWTVSTIDRPLDDDGLDTDVVIVRHKVSQPFAPGFSRNAIFRQLGAGGDDGR